MPHRLDEQRGLAALLVGGVGGLEEQHAVVDDALAAEAGAAIGVLVEERELADRQPRRLVAHLADRLAALGDAHAPQPFAHRAAELDLARPAPQRLGLEVEQDQPRPRAIGDAHELALRRARPDEAPGLDHERQALGLADPLLVVGQLLVRERGLAEARIGDADRVVVLGEDVGGHAHEVPLGRVDLFERAFSAMLDDEPMDSSHAGPSPDSSVAGALFVSMPLYNRGMTVLSPGTLPTHPIRKTIRILLLESVGRVLGITAFSGPSRR